MKRLYIAIFLILLALMFSVTEYILVKKSCDDFTDVIDTAQNYYSVQEYSKANETINTAQKMWNKRTTILNSFIDHTQTEIIKDNFSELSEYSENKKKDEFLNLCKKTKRQLLSMKESELPCFENIF